MSSANQYGFRITQEGSYVGVMPEGDATSNIAHTRTALYAASIANAYIGGYQLPGFEGLDLRPNQQYTATEVAIAALGPTAITRLVPQFAR